MIPFSVMAALILLNTPNSDTERERRTYSVRATGDNR